MIKIYKVDSSKYVVLENDFIDGYPRIFTRGAMVEGFTFTARRADAVNTDIKQWQFPLQETDVDAFFAVHEEVNPAIDNDARLLAWRWAIASVADKLIQDANLRQVFARTFGDDFIPPPINQYVWAIVEGARNEGIITEAQYNLLSEEVLVTLGQFTRKNWSIAQGAIDYIIDQTSTKSEDEDEEGGLDEEFTGPWYSTARARVWWY